jgi:type II secretory pathway component PulJ
MKRRGGYTLVELSLILTFSGTLMVVAFQVVRSAMRTSQFAAEQIERQRAYEKLALTVREDAALAKMASTPQPNALMLQLDEQQRVTYRRQARRWVREHTVSGQRVAIEVYLLGGDVQPRFEVLQTPARVRIELIRTTPGDATGNLDYQIEASLGRWPAPVIAPAESQL